MKFNFVLLLCTFFLFINNISSQNQNITFKFKVWRNSVSSANYLGEYTAVTYNNQVHSSTANFTSQICPGEQLILQNRSSLNGNALSFDGTTYKATLGLTPKNHCTTPTNSNPLTHIADVCQGISGCTTAPQHFNSWNWGSNISITVPAYTSSTGNTYLMFAYGSMGNIVSSCGCGNRYAFTKLQIAPTAPIDNFEICPNDPVSLTPPSGFTYSNWSPNDPNTNPPTTTTDYTVDIIHTASGCTQHETFTIGVNNPDKELINVRELCYNKSLTITEDDFNNLNGDHTYPKQIIVNGVVIKDLVANTSTLPHTIDGRKYGYGVVTIEYVYYTLNGGGTCSKTYQVMIRPEIIMNLQSSYAVCNNNFQQICATGENTPQAGATYEWSHTTIGSISTIGNCFTPTAYGNYNLLVTDQFGCQVSHTINVYNPGVGINHPRNITFCSMTENAPRFIGWDVDPFGPIFYGIQWTYTPINGETTNIQGGTTIYQAPYLGQGTYTALVSANNCTETFNIIVTDLYKEYHNHSNSHFFISSPSPNLTVCQPISSVLGGIDRWTVTDKSNNYVPFSMSSSGIKFSSVPGDNYTVKLRREVPSRCEVFITQLNTLKKGDTKNPIFKAKIQLFPNPTKGLVNIQLTDATSRITTVEIINNLGNVILEEKFTTDGLIQIDLSKEISGIYMIQVINGDDKFVEKIVKE